MRPDDEAAAGGRMNSPVDDTDQLEFVPLTPDTWHLFDDLLGPSGLQGGCWCAYFLLTSREFDGKSPTQHRETVSDAVHRDTPMGLLSVDGDRPVGWVAVSPRGQNHRLHTSMVAKTPDDPRDTWSITCLYVDRRSRQRGLAARLVRAAVSYAADNGAARVEGYPVDPGGSTLPAGALYHGLLQTFLDEGFELLARRGKRRALVRRRLTSPASTVGRRVHS